MNWIVITAAGIALSAIARIAIQQQADAWIRWRANCVSELDPYDRDKFCAAFHEIMAVPKPWYVKLNEWMEERHV